MKEKYYCPTCIREAEVIEACGASNYFCNQCKKLISSQSILREVDLEKIEEHKEKNI